MRDRPDGAELLHQARATLLDELAGELPETKRYDLLMVASAMAIAARELEALLAGDPEAAPDAAAIASARHLATDIRAGKRDGDPKLHDLLSRDAARRLALSNPKLLDR